MLAFTVALILAQRPSISDAQLRKTCASLYNDLGAYEVGRTPKAWSIIAKIPYAERINKLKRLLVQKPTATEYAGICYSLGISGYKPADMTDRLLSFVAVSHYERRPPVGDLQNLGPIFTAIDRIRKRFPTDAVLSTLLRASGDGELGPAIGGLVADVFMKHPRQSMRIVGRERLEGSVSKQLWYEVTREDARNIDRKLHTLSQDKDRVIRRTARRVARSFIRSYNENTSAKVPKLKDWTSARRQASNFLFTPQMESLPPRFGKISVKSAPKNRMLVGQI